MKLISSPTSPFARKARVLILELNLQDKIECVDFGPVTPVTTNDQVFAANPLGFIPVLILDDGSSLYDSPVICEYIDNVGKGGFFPQEPSKRFPALKRQSLADGLMDYAVALRYETAMRPKEYQWQELIDHQNDRIQRAIDEFENLLLEFSQVPTIGEVTVACALGYLDFRYTSLDWRMKHPRLAEWIEEFSQRESMQKTIPVG